MLTVYCTLKCRFLDINHMHCVKCGEVCSTMCHPESCPAPVKLHSEPETTKDITRLAFLEGL